MTELEQLLGLLGAKSFAEAVASISNFNKFLDAAMASCGRSNATDALVDIQARAARAPFALAVEKATGKTGDEALGLIRAALAAHSELPKAQARVAELEKANDGHAFDALLAKAKDEKRVTPHIEKTTREAFASGEMTLKSAEFFFANLPVIGALQTPPAPAKSDASEQKATLTVDGKELTYAELRPAQKAALKRSNPDLYAAMRSAAGITG